MAAPPMRRCKKVNYRPPIARNISGGFLVPWSKLSQRPRQRPTVWHYAVVRATYGGRRDAAAASGGRRCRNAAGHPLPAAPAATVAPQPQFISLRTTAFVFGFPELRSSPWISRSRPACPQLCQPLAMRALVSRGHRSESCAKRDWALSPSPVCDVRALT